MKGCGENLWVGGGTAVPHQSTNPPIHQSSIRGSALIVVLWVIGLMGLLVGSFAFDAHLESRITSYYRKRTRATALAESGIEVGKLLMLKMEKVDPKAEVPAGEDDDPWYAPARQLEATGAVHQELALGEGTVVLDIVTEQALRSVNHLKKEEEWEPVLAVVGVPEEMWPELIEAFLDWTDPDDEARVDGAETEDYYKTLDPPYRARNGDLYSVDELLSIKGFTRAIVYGGALDPESEDPVMITAGGLSGLLTVFGDPKINVNAAPYNVLLTLPSGARNDGDLVAEDIVEERAGTSNIYGVVEDNFFTGDADMFGRMPSLNEAERRDYVTAEPASLYYRITARGRVNNVTRTISCVVKNNGGTLSYLQWTEEE